MTSNQPSSDKLTRRAFLRSLSVFGLGSGAVALSHGWIADAQTVTPTRTPTPRPLTPIDKAIAKQVSDLIDTFAGSKSPVGLAVGIVYPGSQKGSPPVIQRFYRGETAQGNGQLPDNQTVFGIGSVGKVFTTTLLADMVFNQKLLALDDLVQPYYDKLAPGQVTLPTYKGQGIRFIHLATHTAGLPDQPKAIRGDACGTPMAAVYDFLNTFKLPQAPGTVASYSDMGFDLLSDILNRISGSTSRDQSLHDLLRRAQLTMPNTGAITLALQQNAHYATGYDVDSQNKLTPAAQLTCDSGSDHVGQVASTLDDMVEWAQFNLGLTSSPFNSLLPQIQHEYYQMGHPLTMWL